MQKSRLVNRCQQESLLMLPIPRHVELDWRKVAVRVVESFVTVSVAMDCASATLENWTRRIHLDIATYSANFSDGVI